jgi:hypothetical protein
MTRLLALGFASKTKDEVALKKVKVPTFAAKNAAKMGHPYTATGSRC